MAVFILQVFVLEQALFSCLFLHCTTHGDVCFAGISHSSPHILTGTSAGPHQQPLSLTQAARTRHVPFCKCFWRADEMSQSATTSALPTHPTTLYARKEELLCCSHLKHLNHRTAEVYSFTSSLQSSSWGGSKSARVSHYTRAALA